MSPRPLRSSGPSACEDDVLVFAHIGDLHITTQDQANYAAFQAIVAELNLVAEQFDFVVLPGDNADDGLPSQYALVDAMLSLLRAKAVHVITGDHDMPKAAGAATTSLTNFYGGLTVARRLPYASHHRGIRCLFLDMSGPGAGHLDFRIGADQAQWLDHELKQAAQAKERCAVFMHTYPADINEPHEKARMIKALASKDVLLVDVGHTHYNELSNDGRKIYAATRSTGQIEEDGGRAGYSIAAIDGTVVSWRFRLLSDGRPAVLVTAPADRRLATRKDDPDHRGHKASVLRGNVVWHRPIVRLTYSLDGQPPVEHAASSARRFKIPVDLTGVRSVVVEALDDRGAAGSETIELARDDDFARLRDANGSDADRIGRWIERGILGTQLGPNRNGRGW